MGIGPQKIHIGRALTFNFGVHYPFKTDLKKLIFSWTCALIQAKARAVIWQI